MTSLINELEDYIKLVKESKEYYEMTVSEELNFFEKILKDLNLFDPDSILKFRNSHFFIMCLILFSDEVDFLTILKEVSEISTYIDQKDLDYSDFFNAAEAIKMIVASGDKLTPIQIREQISKLSVETFIDNQRFCELINKYKAFEVVLFLSSFLFIKDNIRGNCEKDKDQSSRKRALKIILLYANGKLSEEESEHYKLFDEKLDGFLESFRDFKDVIEQFKGSYLQSLRQEIKYVRERSKIIISTAKEIKKDLSFPVGQPAIYSRTTLPDNIEWQFTDALLAPLFKQVETNLRNQYGKMCSENEEMEKQLNFTDLQKFLADLGIKYESLEQSVEKLLYAEKNVEKIKRVVNFLIELGFEAKTIFSTNLIYLVVDSQEVNITMIEQFISLRYFDKEFVKANLGILLSTAHAESGFTPRFKTLVDNIAFLQSVNIGLSDEKYDRNIILYDIADLMKIYTILEPYGLSNENILFMLSNLDKIDVLDMMIENDIDLVLLKQLIGNYNGKLAIKKILISESIGERVVSSKNVLSKVITGYDNFYVSDTEIDSCIFNETTTFLETYQNFAEVDINAIIKELDANYLEGTSYVISDLKLSVQKIKRNAFKCKTIKDVLELMLKNVIATSNQINDVIGVIMSTSFPNDFTQLKMSTNNQ